MSSSLCILCRGAKYLCGRAYCPILAKTRAYVKVSNVSDTVFGSSPPSVFIGRIGYPNVFAGPMAPAETGDTSIYDYPELWRSKPVDEVVSMRLSLFLGRRVVGVTNIDDRFVQELQQMVLTLRSVDIEMRFAKRPRGYSFSEFEPPIGPRAPIDSFKVVSIPSTDRVVERIYGDVDATASEAVVELYRGGVPVSQIQKIFSVGALGSAKRRRLVPTRWAITAVDDIISRHLITERIRFYSHLGEIQVFVRFYAKNLFISILIPGEWSFEWMEAWFPKSTWNPNGSEVVVEGDHELFRPRDEYASIGGCYYAARLATAEYLHRIARQAVAVVLREIYPGFDIPIGVWFVREQLRAMYSQEPYRVSSLEEALRIVDKYSALGSKTWVRKSRILTLLLKNIRLDNYFR